MRLVKKYIKKMIRYIMWCKQFRQEKDKCAYLFGTPTHTNIGDSAIIVAEKEFLKKCGYRRIVEVTTREYEAEREEIKRALPRNADIYLPGGGNMGSLWPMEEEWRMHIIEDLLRFNRHILIFPQTIYYEDTPEAITLKKKTVELYNSKKNLTITAREKISYEFMKNLYTNLKVLYSPDIVLSMKQQVFSKKRYGILVCFRNDKERIISEVEERLLINNLREKSYHVDTIDTMSDEQITKENREYIVRKKLGQIAAARLIITDRLHGMVFAAITGTPCLVLGNNHHKVYGTYEWIKDLDYIQFVQDIQQIEILVQEFYNKSSCIFKMNLEVFSELYRFIKERRNGSKS